MKRIFLVASLMHSLLALSQVTNEQVRYAFANQSKVDFPRLNNMNLTERFYQLNNYNLAWLKGGDSILKNDLLFLISSSAKYGLEASDYQFSLIQSIRSGDLILNGWDSISIDIQLTDAALEFLSDLRYGSKLPQLRYNGLKYERSDTSLVSLLSEYSNRGYLEGISTEAEPCNAAYKNAKELLLHFNEVMDNKSFREVKITSSLVSSSNISLVEKLYQLGIIDSTFIPEGNYLRKKLQETQRMLNVLNDGALRNPTLAALNIPLWVRREELKLLMNHIRYINSLGNQKKLLVVNIPSTTLYVYDHDSIVLDSKIIAGKPTSPTPTLTSSVTEVIVYPYWNVPQKIAVRELLPMIKQDVGYLDANNYQVLDKNGKIVNPYSITWDKLSTSYFPYSIRQCTGCDNSLGLLKFNFYNPFSVYLHDTPAKGLFYLTKRFFSHGCMRVEKPVELSKLMLKEKASTIESLISQCLKDQKPKTIILEDPIPIVVLYGTAWYNTAGEIQFFDDVYHQLNLSKNPVAGL